MATKIKILAAKSAHFPLPLLEPIRSLPPRHAYIKELANDGYFPNKCCLGPGVNY